MRKTKPRIVTSDAEIDAAIRRARIYEKVRPKAIAAVYRPKTDAMAITLATGVELIIPRKLLQGLESATPAQVAKVEIVGAQSSLHWEALDVDHYIPDLIDGMLGSRAWMSELGKVGGTSRSVAKQSAARANGHKGGRPRKNALA
jgi:hypothetical protein